MITGRAIPEGAPPLSDLAEVEREIAGLGAHFGFRARDSPLPGDAWRPLADLLDGSPALAHRYEQTRIALAAGGATVPLRAAASIGHLGLVARLLCPTIGAALLGFRLRLESIWWQPTLGVMPLAGSLEGLGDRDPVRDLLDGPVATLTRYTEGFSLSRKILLGNVDSAVNGAAVAIGAVREDLRQAAYGAARAAGVEAGTGLGRNSCCLIYQLSAPGSPSYCGDCVLPTGR